MRSLLASVRPEGGYDRLDRAVRSLEEEWRHGEPTLERHWAEHDPEGTTSVLAALVKADLRCRFARGERPAVNDYLGRFPVLGAESERMLSLIYEEFCLREEQGERPDAESFCARYAPWRDSLASQLKYHQLLSRVVGPPAVPPRFPEPGEHFQEFAIDSVLGQGGAARVYRARNDLLGGREVALKVSPDRGQEPSIMGRLDHAHIVPVHNVVFQPETRLRGLIMPYRAGSALDEVIRRVNPASRPHSARVIWKAVVAATAPSDIQALPDRTGWGSFPMRGTYAQGVAWIIAALAEAVAHAHAREIHHRDIKPANVLLTLQNGPQLLDFNLAHDPHAAEQAEAALRGGTLPYMAPEQLEAFIDPARWETVGAGADIYALGLVMHELLTGQAPEVPDQSLPLPRAIRSLLDRRVDLPSAARRVNPAIPHALEAITLRCLAYSGADRYPSALALADDLRRFLKRKPLRTAVNPSTNERLDNWSRRNWLILVVLALAGGAAWYLALPQLFPIERREPFLAAQAALDEENPLKAIGLLAPLVEQFPDSRLARIHLSAAWGLAGNVKQAAKLYSTTLPISERDLVDCCAKSPATVRRLEALGIALTAGKDKYWGLARPALETAIRLGSTSEDVLQHATLVDEHFEDYPAALDKLTASIQKIKAAKPLDRARLIDRYHARARVTFRLAEKQQSRGTEKASDEARTLYDRAIEDLNRSATLFQAEKPRRICANATLRVEVEIGLGELEVQSLRRAPAEAHRLRAKTLLETLDRAELKHTVSEQLDQDLAKLAKRIETLPPENTLLGSERLIKKTP